jgi:6-phosphofructokinase 1
MKKMAIITSGGDAPGMNAAIRSLTKTAINKGVIPFGIFDGYLGMLEGRGKVLTHDDVNNIIHLGGTILGSARCEAFRTHEGRQKAILYLKEQEIDTLVVIGGDGSYAGALALANEMQINVLGIPGTIDNDIYGTDYTLGYDTALNTVIEAVDKIRDTANSHRRVFFVEVMGRHAGFLALYAAIASGAHMVLIPEEPTDLSKVIQEIRQNAEHRRATIILVAEGDDAGHAVDVMNAVRPHLEGYDLRHSVLGHIQRGGSPTMKDRLVATLTGNAAVHALLNGETGIALGMKGEEVVMCPIAQAIKENTLPNMNLLRLFDEMHPAE